MNPTHLPADRSPCPDPAHTILVVEDNPQAAKLLSIGLTRAGYDVLVAADGGTALELARRCRPKAITLDILLPDRDGWEVLAELKASPRTRDIPVVIVSVLDQQSLGYRLGAADYLVKPIERSALLRALRRSVARGSEGGDFRKVMVVHTDPDELQLLARIVAQQAYEVIQALGHEEAALLAARIRPDLVVTDLPAVDYFALLEWLRAAPETADIPVLALTSGSRDHARTEDRVEFVMVQEDETVEERLLASIALLFGQEKPAGGQT
jgi:DNA-binding response OmpR family regulator